MKIVCLLLFQLLCCLDSVKCQSVEVINSQTGFIANYSNEVLTILINDSAVARLHPKWVYLFKRKSLSPSTKVTIYYREEDYQFRDAVLRTTLLQALADLPEKETSKGNTDELSSDYKAVAKFLQGQRAVALIEEDAYNNLMQLLKEIQSNQTTYNLFGYGHSFLLLKAFKSHPQYRAVKPLFTIEWRKKYIRKEKKNDASVR